MNRTDKAKVLTVNHTLTVMKRGMDEGRPLSFDEIGRVFLAALDRNMEGKI